MSRKRQTGSERRRAARSGKIDRPDVFDIVNAFLGKRMGWVAMLSLMSSIVFGFLLFEAKVDMGGDDSEYIRRAWHFIHKGEFPAFQGPLYPVLLSIPVLLAGINLPVLKAFSFILVTLHVLILFQAIRRQFPPLLVAFTLLLTATNGYVMYYSSQTYSEALFFLIQSIVLYLFIRYFTSGDLPDFTLRTYWKKVLLFCFTLLLLIQTKSVAIAAAGASILFLLAYGRWKPALSIAAGVALLFSAYTLLRNMIWDTQGTQFAEQARLLMQVNAYRESEGMETFSGFVQRFIDNSNLYLSRHLWMFFGVRDYYKEALPNLTVFSYFLLAVAAWQGIRKNRSLVLLCLYVAAMCGTTFIVLQKSWDQWRVIINYFSLIALVFSAGIYYLLKSRHLDILQAGFVLLLCIALFSGARRTIDSVEKHYPILVQNMNGDMLAGYTPDWKHYILMSRWAASNLPKDRVIACRKPGISFIWSNGRDFQGIFRLVSQDPDTLLQSLREHNAEFVILANLRKYPAVKTKETISTIRNTLYLISQKYPDRLRRIHKIGADDDEPAELWQVRLN